MNVEDLELTVLVPLGYKTGQKSDGIESKPGESQCSVVLEGASGYVWLACLVWVAPQPLQGWQERVRLWTTSHEKEGPCLGIAEVEWAGHFLVGCKHEEPVI